MSLISCAYSLSAQNDVDDLLLRTGPVDVQGTEAPPLEPAHYEKYPFLNLDANVIEYNGSDWSDIRRRIDAIDDTVMSIVHIGDSHLQAEGATSRTRALLQKFYGSAGRGLITPLKLAGTNQPTDYVISSSSKFIPAIIMRRPWAVPMGFTGVSLCPESKSFNFTITTKAVEGIGNDFDVLKVYCRGDMPKLTSATASPNGPVNFIQNISADTLRILLLEPVNTVTLEFETAGKCSVSGFKLENSMTGIEYHVIGNNGARYDTYNGLGNFGSSIKALSPNLIIISLGANEAFGRITDAAFYGNIDRLVRDLQQNNPKAKILLVTPGECMKRDGKTFHINTDVDRLRKVILQYGRDNHVATWDWYEIAGGEGSSVHWVEHDLLSKDRIHNTWPGYHLQGNLFYDALVKAFHK